MLEMPIFAGIIPIHKEIFALFRQKAPDFIASWWKSSGNSREKIRPCGNTGADFLGIAIRFK